ncbi:hypothetical protein C3L33_21090, partial [Rhododendron williamsianum]
MAIFNFQILLYSLSMFFFGILFPQTNSLTFNLTNFNEPDQYANIIKNQSESAAYFSTGGLQVTSNERSANLAEQVGKATYIHQLDLWDETTGKLTDFNTHFVFVIASYGNKSFGDGLTFFLAPDASQTMGGGGAMGLPFELLNGTIKNTSTFVAVEFDTYGNGPNAWDPVDISPVTHVGINVNSLNSTNFSVWHCDIPQGIENEAWITYDSSSLNLSVVVTGSINNSRVYDSIHSIINLTHYLPNRVTIGFSASTGASFETHTIKSWDFNSSLVISETNKKISLGAVVGSVVGSGVFVGGFVLVGFGLWRRSRAKEEDEFEIEMSLENEFEAGAGPKKFSYSQLSRATNNFGEEQKLGEGGFGGVYRGFLRELNFYIAVKRISKGSKQGIKDEILAWAGNGLNMCNKSEILARWSTMEWEKSICMRELCAFDLAPVTSTSIQMVFGDTVAVVVVITGGDGVASGRALGNQDQKANIKRSEQPISHPEASKSPPTKAVPICSNKLVKPLTSTAFTSGIIPLEN